MNNALVCDNVPRHSSRMTSLNASYWKEQTPDESLFKSEQNRLATNTSENISDLPGGGIQARPL